MRKSCKVSVVIPCFNHGEFLREAVVSAINANRDDMELIVVNDGSADERTAPRKSAMRCASARQLRMVSGSETRGLAGSAERRHRRFAAGKYILPARRRSTGVRGALRSTSGVRILDADPRVGVVYGDAQYIGTTDRSLASGSFEAKRIAAMELHPRLRPLSASLFGSRTAATTAPCQCRDSKIGTSGLVPRRAGGNSPTSRMSSLSIGRPKNRCSRAPARLRTRRRSLSPRSMVNCIGRSGCQLSGTGNRS